MTSKKEDVIPLNKKPWIATESLILYLSVTVMGGCGLAYEYTLSKLASDLLGNSVRQWAIIIGVMMFFMGVGSDLQKYFSEKKILPVFIAGEVALGLLGAFGPMAMLYAYGRFYSHYIIVQYFFVGSIGLLIGLEIPLLTRINERYTNGLKFNLGAMLRMDYIGALLGALVWVFILPKYFSVIEMGFVLGLVSIITALVALVYFRRKMPHFRSATAFGVLSLSLVLVGFNQASQWEVDGLQYLYRDRVVMAKNSPYQHVVVTQSQSGQTSLYINGHLQFNSADEEIYHENLVHPAMSISKSPRRVLILGGGDGLAAREVLKYPEVEKIVLCDLDPMITDLGQNNPWFVSLNNGSLKNAKVQLINNKSLRPARLYEVAGQDQKHPLGLKRPATGQVMIINVDAMEYLRQVPGLFDVIIVDFPDPNAAELGKLYSKWFYEMVHKHMAPGAILVQQSTSPYFTREAFLTIGRTMKSSGFSAVPYHDTVPSFGEWGFWIATRRSLYNESMITERLERIDSLPKGLRYLTPPLIRASLVFGKHRLATNRTDINTIVSGKLHEYYLEGWRHGF
ncbi:MAG: spermidine synthase [Zetaproteobacteria bacterium]|nr:spermidine synthase [Pseudobdellovibrionaceae bacterium]|tara:strand:- start:897 stop:2597 length:1701 start_codon:yes stop_codon:yes gene_type:complete